MNVLVFVEHAAGEAQRASLGVLSKAAAASAMYRRASPGTRCAISPVGSAPTARAGWSWPIRPSSADPLPQPRVDVLARLVADKGFDTVLFGASVLASDVAAALAARLEGGLNWDLIDLASTAATRRHAPGAPGLGRTWTCGWQAEPRIALVRSGTFEPVETGGPLRRDRRRGGRRWILGRRTMAEQAHAESEGPSIEEAEIIVAGGRGLGKPENFALVEDARAGARRRRRRHPGGRRRRLVPVREPGRADGQDRLAEALHRVRHLGRHPAQGRHAVRPARSSRSTRTATLPSSTSATSASSATSTRSCRSSPSSCGRGKAERDVQPGDFPPPFDPARVRGRGADGPADERIDVGILVVGGGPAGLAAAIRAGQLLQERPELAERLGDVPICVVEKGKAARLARALRARSSTRAACSSSSPACAPPRCRSPGLSSTRPSTT